MLSPKTSVKVDSKILYLLSVLVCMYLDDLGGTISSKALNIRILYHYIAVSYHQAINIIA
jgi:hypothetical protein